MKQRNYREGKEVKKDTERKAVNNRPHSQYTNSKSLERLTCSPIKRIGHYKKSCTFNYLKHSKFYTKRGHRNRKKLSV